MNPQRASSASLGVFNNNNNNSNSNRHIYTCLIGSGLDFAVMAAAAPQAPLQRRSCGAAAVQLLLIDQMYHPYPLNPFRTMTPLFSHNGETRPNFNWRFC